MRLVRSCHRPSRPSRVNNAELVPFRVQHHRKGVVYVPDPGTMLNQAGAFSCPVLRPGIQVYTVTAFLWLVNSLKKECGTWAINRNRRI